MDKDMFLDNKTIAVGQEEKSIKLVMSLLYVGTTFISLCSTLPLPFLSV